MQVKRLSYPCRYGDTLHRFAKPVPVLSMITKQMIDFVYNVHRNRLLNWNYEVLSAVNLQSYVDAVTAMEPHCPIVLGLLKVPLGQYQDLENINDFFTMAITGFKP